MTLKELILSLKEDQAILHYNVATFEQIKAGILAVKETNIPLIFGVSEGERNYLTADLIKEIVDFYQKDLPIFLNADHSKSFETAKQAIDLNYNAVLFDGSELSLDENIKITKELVNYRNSRTNANYNELMRTGKITHEPMQTTHKPMRTDKDDIRNSSLDSSQEFASNKDNVRMSSRESSQQFALNENNVRNSSREGSQQFVSDYILIEGEVGKIEGKSEIQKEVEVKKENLTKVEEAIRFVEETKVDFLAVSIGNIHGITEKEPELDFKRGKEIKEAVKIPLVLHGASGLSLEKIKKCISIGFKIVHLNTEFRKIWKDKLSEEIKKETVTPYKILEPVIEEIKKKIIYYQLEFYR